MASSVWESVQSNVPSTGMAAVASSAVSDPTSILNTQLASALSTMGDAQFWEESIAPSTIRTSLSNSDPSNPNSTPTLLRGMKWLLATMSKGRNVSDFYPQVVKLVGAQSLEVRKMVYMYLVQYADHDATTRELSLLSINSFQRGLADSEQLIRALALRVLSSIRISDILQIQILGVQKCARDKSPYVRKCAANALAKLSPRCDVHQREMLLEIMQHLLDDDTSTMVLTSAITAFCELCPERLELIHASYRKICHLLTDMDEWGQVVVIDMMARYCRQFFREPKAMKGGSAELIDRERRVRRTAKGITNQDSATMVAGLDALVSTDEKDKMKQSQESAGPKKVKRRVVVKGFYSDEEDDSTEEEVYVDDTLGTPVSLSGAMRQRNVLGLGGGGGMTVGGPVSDTLTSVDEDGELSEDHRLLLRSSLPLLKSRNSGVVLAVCSLHYYCGVSSVKVRSALGKALVRIHRDRREIQYVVLTSIRTLAKECPSAFTPFLNDFFIKAMDPSFTRMIKLDILTSLALEPASIEAVLKELRNYIRHNDKAFVCASIRAVGKIVELARIVHDRYGTKMGDIAKERKEANRIALNCLYGLLALTQACQNEEVVGECAIVMERIMLQLRFDSGQEGGLMSVDDSSQVQQSALRRLMLLLVRALSSSRQNGNCEEEEKDEAEEETDDLEAHGVILPPAATASALWVVGEFLLSSSSSTMSTNGLGETARTKTAVEISRLVAGAFLDLKPNEKLQGVHFATKMLVAASVSGLRLSSSDAAVCEHILSVGRCDVDPDVRDRSRFESGLIQRSIGLKYDLDGFSESPSHEKNISKHKLKKILLQMKPPSSSLPLEEEEIGVTGADSSNGNFRFGTLSSLVSHRARTAYLPLPPWSAKDSPDSLRDPPEESLPTEHAQGKHDGWVTQKDKSAGFYDSSGDDSSSDESSTDSSSDESTTDGSSSEDSSSADEGTSAESSNGDEDSDSSDESTNQDEAVGFKTQELIPIPTTPATNGGSVNPKLSESLVDDATSSSDESSSESSDESSSDDDSVDDHGDLLAIGSSTQPPMAVMKQKSSGDPSTSSSLASGLEGLVMAPLVVEKDTSNEATFENDSSEWMKLVRPELGGGLMVQGRYLRGATKKKEAKLLGLDAEKVTTVCLQVKFENRRTDAGILRRIRIVQRGAPGGSISTSRVVVPQEIEALKKDQLSLAVLGMDFASASNRDGSLVARFEFKSDRGSNAVDVKPPLGELIRPTKMTMADLDGAMKRMKGIHQRATSSFTMKDKEAQGKLPSHIVKQTCLTPLDMTWKNSKFHLVGMLPASVDNVFVVVQCNFQTGVGNITVCCSDTLACASILDLFKHSVASL